MIKEAARLILESERPVIYAGGGILKARAAGPAAGAGRADRHPRRHDPHGPGRLPRQPPAVPRHAGHARQLHGRHLDAAGRPAHRPRLPLRRPGHRQGRRLRPRRQDHPRRHRPGRAGQGRRPDVPIVGDCRLVIEELVQAVRDLLEGGAVAARPHAVERADPRLAGASSRSPTSPTRRATRSSPSSCSSSCGTTRPDDTIVVSGVGQHQMWASQYWQFDHPYTWVNSGGLGTMGFAVPAAIGAKVGHAGPDGVGGRRRRLLPDDGPGAGDGVDRAHPGEGGHPQQRLPRHGPPVAGDVLRRALLRGVPVARRARLREVGRGHGLRRHPGRDARGGAAGHREGQRDRRPPGGRRVPQPPPRRCSRWCRPARPTTTSSPATPTARAGGR